MENIQPTSYHEHSYTALEKTGVGVLTIALFCINLQAACVGTNLPTIIAFSVLTSGSLLTPFIYHHLLHKKTEQKKSPPKPVMSPEPVMQHMSTVDLKSTKTAQYSKNLRDAFESELKKLCLQKDGIDSYLACYDDFVTNPSLKCFEEQLKVTALHFRELEFSDVVAAYNRAKNCIDQRICTEQSDFADEIRKNLLNYANEKASNHGYKFYNKIQPVYKFLKDGKIAFFSIYTINRSDTLEYVLSKATVDMHTGKFEISFSKPYPKLPLFCHTCLGKREITFPKVDINARAVSSEIKKQEASESNTEFVIPLVNGKFHLDKKVLEQELNKIKRDRAGISLQDDEIKTILRIAKNCKLLSDFKPKFLGVLKNSVVEGAFVTAAIAGYKNAVQEFTKDSNTYPTVEYIFSNKEEIRLIEEALQSFEHLLDSNMHIQIMKGDENTPNPYVSNLIEKDGKFFAVVTKLLVIQEDAPDKDKVWLFDKKPFMLYVQASLTIDLQTKEGIVRFQPQVENPGMMLPNDDS